MDACVPEGEKKVKYSILETKIRWYLKHVGPIENTDILELIVIAYFDENGNLSVRKPYAQVKKYMKYWRQLIVRTKEKKSPVEEED